MRYCLLGVRLGVRKVSLRKTPGNMTLQRGRVFGMVLLKRRVTDQGERVAG